MIKTDILDVVSRKLSPYIFLFGFYLVSYGHISPGGGFQGGVVIASGLILLAMGQDSPTVELYFPARSLTVAEAASYMLLVFAGLVGVLLGVGFLADFISFDETYTQARGPFRVVFILLLNILIGVKVAAGVSLICIHLFRREDE
jgi:multicomponent Na+:H+ antiporter subunit B